jgi:hypothetical protein
MTLTDPRRGATAPATARLSPLAAEVLAILQAEVGHPPLSAESLVNVLNAVGFGTGRLPVPVVEGALSELLQAGQLEVLSRFGERRFRALRQDTSAKSGGSEARDVATVKVAGETTTP